MLLIVAQSALAQDAKLIAEGKKEGKVVIYGSMETDIFEGVQQAFEKKTGIKVDYWRAAGATVLERASSERRANKVGYDLVLNNAGPMEILLAEGALAKYDSPLAKNFAAGISTSAVGTKLSHQHRRHRLQQEHHRSDKAPKSLEDLLKPEFNGKLAFPDPQRGAVAVMWPMSCTSSWARSAPINICAISPPPGRSSSKVFFPPPRVSPPARRRSRLPT